MLEDKMSFLGAGAGLLVLWLTATAVYRLFFHPLAKFPGPRLAAITTWYEGYYDVFLKGKFTFQFGRLHKKYGPIVRIGPNEVHILDPEYFNVLYNMSSRFDKNPWYYRMLGNPESLFSCERSETARLRRGALSPFFSANAIAKFQPMIQQEVDKLVGRMTRSSETDEPIPLFYAFRCITVDLIGLYVLGVDLGLMELSDWGREFYTSWRGLWNVSPLVRQFPWMLDLFMAMPRWLLGIVNKEGLGVVDMFAHVDELTKKALEEDAALNGTTRVEKKPYPTVICEIAKDENLPQHERSFSRLAVEANSLIAAGFETTGHTLTHCFFNVLSHRTIYDRLVKELEEAIPDPNQIPSYQVLEKLPLVNACVKESLRLSVGAYGRLSRVNRNGDIKYKDWVIPKGCAFGMSCLYIERNEDVIPRATSFEPDRWLGDEKQRRYLEHYLLAFGRGPRICAGINLAYAEMYTVLATVVRRLGHRLSIWDTTARDMEAEYDYFAGMLRHENGRVMRVKLAAPQMI